MSKLKKVVVALMAAATVGTLGVSAFAAYAHPEFKFDLDKYGISYSDPAQKQDDLGYAMANCKEGTISSTAYMWLSVETSDMITNVAGDVKATGLNNYMLTYRSGEYGAKKDLYYRLCGQTDAYGVYVKGKWDP